MNAQSIEQLFLALREPGTLTALGPVLALAAGVLLVLLADISPAIRWLRGPFLLAALGLAASLELRVLVDPPGAVLSGSFAADRAGALWGLLFLCSTLLAWLASVDYYRGEDAALEGEHDALMLCACAGMMLMAQARDLLVFFLGLELLSIPLYALAAFRRSRAASVQAGLKYFLLGAFASALFLYGAALIYADTGSIALGALREHGPRSVLGLQGVALLVASVFFKISVFPFHLWAPDVYHGSPTPVTLLMATGTKAAGFGFLLNAAFLLPRESAALVAGIALVTMAAGNLGAFAQVDLKRMLAWSGVAHAGTVLLAISALLAGDPAREQGALQAGLFYLGVYVFTAAGAFGILAWLESGGGEDTRIDSLRGLARRRPGMAAALALFLLSLAGLPGSGGFWGKWLVFAAMVRAGQVGLAVVAVLLSVVALAYYLRVIVAMYMQDEPEGRPAPERPRRLGVALAAAACSAVVLATGFLPDWFLAQLP